MKSTLNLFCIGILLLTTSFFAPSSQAQNFEWAKMGGNYNPYQNGYSYCFNYGVTYDNEGNLYSIGTYWDTLHLQDTIIVNQNGNNHTQNLFITKYSPTGKRLWIRNFISCDGMAASRSSAIRIDPNGDVLFAGYAKDSILGQYFGHKAFICKISQTGQLIWIKKFGDWLAFTLDNAGNIYTIFNYHTSYPVTYDSANINPVNSYLLSKMNTAGQAEWIKQFPCSQPLAFRASININPAQTELLIRHQYSGTVTIGNTVLTSPAFGNYLARFSSTTGEVKKIIPVITSTSFELSHAVWVNNQAIVFTGNNSYTSTYQIGDSVFNVGADNGSHSIVAAIDTGGMLVWEHIINHGELNTVAVAGDKVYVGGAANNNTTINGDTLMHNSWSTLGLIACYDLLGSFRSYTLGGVTKNANRFMFLAASPQNIVYASGHYTEWYPYGPFYGLFGNDSLQVLGRGAVFFGRLKGHQSICSGQDTSFASDLTGSSYQWQINNGTGFVSITSGNSLFNGITTATLQLTNVPSSYNGYTFRCLVDGTPGYEHVLYVNEFPAIPTVSVNPASICDSGFATLDANAPNCTNCFYIWTPADYLNRNYGPTVVATPPSTTTYEAHAIQKGCISSNQVTLSLNPSPAISINYSGCGSDSLHFSSSVLHTNGISHIEWYVNNSLADTGNIFTLANPANGTQVFAKMQAMNLCNEIKTTISSPLVVNCTTTGIQTPLSDYSLEVLPNPVKTELLIKIIMQKSGPVHFRIMEASGKTVYNCSRDLPGGEQKIWIDMSRNANGIYYLVVTHEGKTLSTKIQVAK